MEKEKNKTNAIVISGKRKTAIARATIKSGTGKIMINKQPYEGLDFFRKLMIEEPLTMAKKEMGKISFDIDVSVKGGGKESQIEAARLVIAKALVSATKSEKLKRTFLMYDRNLLVADVRRKEACKPGDSKARKKRQKSYR